ncbi:hypothetical protein ABVT39_005753, partial [Epinephelus coioides]
MWRRSGLVVFQQLQAAEMSDSVTLSGSQRQCRLGVSTCTTLSAENTLRELSQMHRQEV